ncbi:MAG: sulfite exporter TauE/SafE family protein [Burkholderiales bacterium]
MEWVVVLLLGVAAGTVGGIVGFGASIILMPALVWVFGAKDAVPMMAIAAVLANASRVAVWWRDVDWRACGVYCITAIPFAALGASTLVVLEARFVEGALGVFFLAMIPVRRWLQSIGLKVVRWHLAIVGIFIGFLSGIVASTGPINTPFFLAYGLVKGAYLSTEALGSVAVGLTKSIVFRNFGAMPWDTLVRGLIVGASLMVGSYLAKRWVLQLSPDRFRVVMDGLMAFAGVAMLVGVFRG